MDATKPGSESAEPSRPTRRQLLARLRRRRSLTVRDVEEIGAALKDGRLTEEQVRALTPDYFETERKTHELAEKVRGALLTSGLAEAIGRGGAAARDNLAATLQFDPSRLRAVIDQSTESQKRMDALVARPYTSPEASAMRDVEREVHNVGGLIRETAGMIGSLATITERSGEQLVGLTRQLVSLTRTLRWMTGALLFFAALSLFFAALSVVLLLQGR